MRLIVLILSIIFGGLCFSRPTSNVINAVYSLQDDFFLSYNFPSMPFRDRVTICESFNELHYDSLLIGASTIGDQAALWMFCEREGTGLADHLYFKLVKDKKKKRDLLVIFHQKEQNAWMKLLRIDVIQYDKRSETRWVNINAADIIPKLTWNDLYAGISEDAKKNIFSMRPAVTADFSDDGSISITIAWDYIEQELVHVREYLNDSEVDPQSILLTWDKNNSRFTANIK